MAVLVKICGIRTPEMAQVVAREGASHIGLMHFERSPRHLTLTAARELAPRIPAGLQRVGVFVDPDDETLDAFIDATGLHMVQLHGHESPDRVQKINERFGLPTIKAISVRDAADVAKAADYEQVADLLLFDAKPPKNSAESLPGGTGQTFDWRLLDAKPEGLTWALSGGLNPENVGDAIRATGASFVDVSSGVETAPGEKSAEKISAFMAAVKDVSE